MKRLILPLIISFAAGPLFAQNVNVYIPRDGGGVVQKPGNVSAQEAALLLGDTAPPEGATGVILEPGKPPRWTNLPPSEVDKNFGGDGTPELQLLPEDDPKKPIPVFDEDEKPTDPNELFPEEDSSASAIAPKAGTWIGELVNSNFEGCPAGIGTAVKAQTQGLDGTPIQGKIDADFTPPRMAPQLDWTKTGPNSWVGTLDQMTNGTGVRMQWAMRIKSPTLIESRQQLNFALGPMGSCVATNDALMKWKG